MQESNPPRNNDHMISRMEVPKKILLNDEQEAAPSGTAKWSTENCEGRPKQISQKETVSLVTMCFL